MFGVCALSLAVEPMDAVHNTSAPVCRVTARYKPEAHFSLLQGCERLSG